MISFVNVSRHYGLRPVLRNVSLTVPAGRLTAIIGPNGMGKTTLLKVAAGVLWPQQGHVEIDGLRRRGSVEEEREIRARTVYLPDRPWAPLVQTGRQFLIDIGLIYDVPQDEAIDHAERLLQLFELTVEGDRPISSYSNGQKKKICIAGALAARTKVLLLDELFGGGLDPAGIAALRLVLAHLVKTEGRTILMTAPAPELADNLADDFIVLVQGEVVAHDSLDGLRNLTGCDGSPTEVLARLTFPELKDQFKNYVGRGA